VSLSGIEVTDCLVGFLRESAHENPEAHRHALVRALSFDSYWFQLECFETGSAYAIIGSLIDCSDIISEFRPSLCEILLHAASELCIHRRSEHKLIRLFPVLGFILSTTFSIAAKMDDIDTSMDIMRCVKRTIQHLCDPRNEKSPNWILCISFEVIAIKLMWICFDDGSPTSALCRTKIVFESANCIFACLRGHHRHVDFSGIFYPSETLPFTSSGAFTSLPVTQKDRGQSIGNWIIEQMTLFLHIANGSEMGNLDCDGVKKLTPSRSHLPVYEALAIFLAKWTFDFNSHYVSIKQILGNRCGETGCDSFQNNFTASILGSLVLRDSCLLRLILPIGICRSRVAVPIPDGRGSLGRVYGAGRLAMDVHFTPSVIMISACSQAVAAGRAVEIASVCLTQLEAFLNGLATSGATLTHSPFVLSDEPHALPELEVFVRLSCVLSSMFSHITMPDACENLCAKMLCSVSDYLIHQQEILLSDSSIALARLELLPMLVSVWVHFSYALVHFLAARTSGDFNPLADPSESLQHLLGNLHVIFDLIYPLGPEQAVVIHKSGNGSSVVREVSSKWIPLCSLPPCILWYLNSFVFPLVQPLDYNRVVHSLDQLVVIQSDVAGREIQRSCNNLAAWRELMTIKAWLCRYQFAVLRSLDASNQIVATLGVRGVASLGVETFRTLGVLPNIHEWSEEVVRALEASFRSKVTTGGSCGESSVDSCESAASQEDMDLRQNHAKRSFPKRKMSSTCAQCIFNRDIMLHVAAFLNAKRINVMAQCNKVLYSICRDRFLWKKRYFERHSRKGNELILPPIFAEELSVKPIVNGHNAIIVSQTEIPDNILPMKSRSVPLCKNCYQIGRSSRGRCAASPSLAAGKWGAASSSSTIIEATIAESLGSVGCHLGFLRGPSSSGLGTETTTTRTTNTIASASTTTASSSRARHGGLGRRSGCCRSRQALHDWFGLYWVSNTPYVYSLSFEAQTYVNISAYIWGVYIFHTYSVTLPCSTDVRVPTCNVQ
jgi:hypothetical protein